jgi:negative regulator of flagellin synthesis FlgM
MNVRNDIENLSQILASQPAQSAAAGKPSASAPQGSTDTAEVSAIGTQVVHSAGDSDVRLDKVASIQAALQAGTYQVPASAVAQKLIGALLSSDK